MNGEEKVVGFENGLRTAMLSSLEFSITVYEWLETMKVLFEHWSILVGLKRFELYFWHM